MAWAALVVGAATTGYKIYDSAHKSSQAKKLAAANKRPVFKADGSIQEVYDLATSEVNNTRVEDYATRQLEQSQSSGIDAILKSGGKADFGTVHNQFGGQLQAAITMIGRDRAQKVASLNNAAYAKAQSKDAEFSYNRDAPFKDLKQQEAQLRQQSEQSKADAFSAASSTVGGYLTATLKPGDDTGADPAGNLRTSDRVYGSPPELITSASLRQPAPGVMPGANVTPGAVNTNFGYADIWDQFYPDGTFKKKGV